MPFHSIVINEGLKITDERFRVELFPSCCLIAWSANTGHTRRINATATMTTPNYFQQPSSKKTALFNYMVHINNGGLTLNVRQDLFDASRDEKPRVSVVFTV